MHFVSSLSQIAAETPDGYEAASRGFTRQIYVDRAKGSVHMGAGICTLDEGGAIEHHLHSFEESFYILEGQVSVQIGDLTLGLRPGDYGLIPTGRVHAWRNAGDAPARWLEMQAPQPRPLDYGRDTFFVPAEFPAGAPALDPAAAGGLLLGHFDESQLPKPGAPSEMEGFDPTTGVAIKMFVDRSSGALHQSLFLIQYQPGAKIDPHDHTFEESYYILSGRVRATADGQTYELGPGDVIWTGVGCIHSFENAGDEPVTWLETQASLPPAKEAFRFERDWAGEYSQSS
ncbi:MAG: cupin domain-containing protein [Anaerolineales bacterium]|nr:cupin domain-containing protein [Anaerolineales bacterium]